MGRRYKSIKKYSCSDSNSKSHDDHSMKNMKQNSDSSKSCKVISKLLIPEDLMFDILSLLPLKCLLNSARYVCKPWATTIHSSLFAEAYLHRARSKPGLYVENCKYQNNSYFLDIKDDVNGQFEFERSNVGTPQKMGNIVDNCDGILLLCHGPRQIFIVNPILKCWLKIPSLPISLKRSEHKCRVTIARVPHTTEFKLFFVDFLVVLGAYWYVLYVLRIGVDSSWREIARKEAPHEWFFCWKLLYNGDNYLYWITIEGITVMDVDKENIVGQYSLPPVLMGLNRDAKNLRMGNHLSCIVSNDAYYRTFQIYVLDFELGKWSLYHEMGPFDFATACGHEIHILCVVFCLWINHQIIFRASPLKRRNTFVISSETMHFSYNVKTRQLTKIEDIVVGDIKVWLHTNSLVSLPSTPL